MKRIIKKIVEVLTYLIFAKNNSKKVIEKIKDNYEYISFDIFDTLIKRNVYNEKNIFKIVEKKISLDKNVEYNNYYYERINAEKKARRKALNKEVTLDEIYSYLECDEYTKNYIKNIEINTEIQFCTANIEMKKVYEYCISKKKRIYLTSDMYLDLKTIKTILEKNGYTNYEYIYLSSDKMALKRDYSLFDRLIKEQNIKKSKFIHIGDNVISDFIVPKLHGINSIIIKKEYYKSDYYSKRRINHNLSYNILCATANNLVDDEEDVFSNVGNSVLGPLLYGFCINLHKYIEENKIDKIFFLARDSKIIMDTYLIMYPEEFKRVKYLYVSRKAIIGTQLYKALNVTEFLRSVKPLLRRTATVEELLMAISIDIEEYKEKIENIQLHLSDSIFDLDLNKVDELFSLIKMELAAYSKKQEKYFIQYLKQEDFANKVCLVDIGWRGTIQSQISNICLKNNIDCNIYAYYFGIRNVFDSNTKGFVFEGDNHRNRNKVNFTVGLFETLFLSQEGSTLGYRESEKGVITIHVPNEHNDAEINKILSVQNCAIRFIRKMNELQCNSYIDLELENYFLNYTNCSLQPKWDLLNQFGNITFLDDNLFKLVENKKLHFYILHPKVFKKDFLSTHYKIGFLKRVFYIKLPYYKILNFMIKFDK